MSNLILGKFALENLYYSTLPLCIVKYVGDIFGTVFPACICRIFTRSIKNLFTLRVGVRRSIAKRNPQPPGRLHVGLGVAF